MSDMLQLLSNYYKSVLESERIYNEHLLKQKDIPSQANAKDKDKDKSSTPNPNDLVTLQLQKQVNKLTSQIQTLTKQNDKLKETTKSQRITSEERIKNLQSMIKELNDKMTAQNKSNSVDGSPDNNDNDLLTTPRRGSKNDNTTTNNNNSSNNNNTNEDDKPKFHLLSPLGKNTSNGSRASSHTIFDDSTSDSDLDDTELNLDAQSSKDKSNDTFILSLKKYDQVKSNTKLEQVLAESSEQHKKLEQIEPVEKPKQIEKTEQNDKPEQNDTTEQQPNKNKRNKRKLKDKRRKNAAKKLSELDIPNLNRNEPSADSNTTKKKRKLSNKKIQVTSDNEEMLPILSQ